MPKADSQLLSLRHLACIALVYVGAYGAYSLVSVPFWDDWVLISHSPEGLWEMFSQLGRREQFWMVWPFASLCLPVAWAATNFVCWGIVSASTYLLLKGIGWPPNNALWASLLAAAAPLNQARFSLSVLPYSISAASFSVALLFFVRSVDTKNNWLRLSGSILLLLAVTTNSFLTMAPLPILVTLLALHRASPQSSFWDLVRRVMARFELFLLPVLYWGIKLELQPAHGIYADYNQFTTNVPQALIESAWVNLSHTLQFTRLFPDISYFYEGIGTALLMLLGLSGLASLLRLDVQVNRISSNYRWLALSGLLLAAIAAVFPYAMVGLRPSFEELWSTRHQTTLAIVFGPLVFSFLLAALPKKLVVVGCSAMLCVFLAADVSTSRQLMSDTFDTYATLYSEDIAELPDDVAVAVFDEDRSFRMMNRRYRLYELSSIFSQARTKKSILAISAADVIDPQTGTPAQPGSDAVKSALSNACIRFRPHPEYGFGDISSSPAYAELHLRHMIQPPSYFAGLANTLGFLFQSEQTIERAADTLDVSTDYEPSVSIACSIPNGVR